MGARLGTTIKILRCVEPFDQMTTSVQVSGQSTGIVSRYCRNVGT